MLYSSTEWGNKKIRNKQNENGSTEKINTPTGKYTAYIYNSSPNYIYT